MKPFQKCFIHDAFVMQSTPERVNGWKTFSSNLLRKRSNSDVLRKLEDVKLKMAIFYQIYKYDRLSVPPSS